MSKLMISPKLDMSSWRSQTPDKRVCTKKKVSIHTLLRDQGCSYA